MERLKVSIALVLLLFLACSCAGKDIENKPRKSEARQASPEVATQAEREKAEKLGNAANNLNLWAATDENAFYFVQFNSAIIKIAQDGEQVLLTEDSPNWINVADGWLYYEGRSNGSPAIYKICTDGTEKTVLLVYDNLLKIIKKQYALGMFASSRLTHALTAIIDCKTYISSIASMYTMEPAMIAAIIVKEQVTQSAPDEALYLDTAARGTAHSFGLGAIFPITAVEAWTAMSAEDSDIMQKFYIYTSGLPSGALSDIGSMNIYVGAMLMSNDKFNI
ncbi:MAG: DUF5050 domain-containing protein [Clostridiales bacterium]|nr:DUF5050 domain-containing protein [Clostridiales bacterium]